MGMNDMRVKLDALLKSPPIKFRSKDKPIGEVNLEKLAILILSLETKTHRIAIVEKDEKQYPCDVCGKLRTKAEGGTIFTVCDKCWDKLYEKVQ